MGKAYLGGDFLLIVVVLEAYSFVSCLVYMNTNHLNLNVVFLFSISEAVFFEFFFLELLSKTGIL